MDQLFLPEQLLLHKRNVFNWVKAAISSKEYKRRKTARLEINRPLEKSQLSRSSIFILHFLHGKKLYRGGDCEMGQCFFLSFFPSSSRILPPWDIPRQKRKERGKYLK